MSPESILPARFIRYRVEWDAAAKRFNKIPCNQGGYNINHLDPSQWLTYEQANEGVTWDKSDATRPYGVAFVLNGDGWFCIDLDKCTDGQGGWSSEATSIFLSFGGALGEVSMSGTGLHIFGQCNAEHLKNQRRKWDNWKEFYTDGRFIALSQTGPQPIGGGTYTGLDWTDRLLKLVPEREFPGELPDGRDPRWNGPESDDELIAKMLKSKNAANHFGQGVTFEDLWTGNVVVLGKAWPREDGGFDHSSADASLMVRLAFWTGKDMPRMSKLFGQSTLGQRDKWKDRADYRKGTIEAAVRICNEVYAAGNKAQDASEATHTSREFWPTPDFSLLESPEREPPAFPLDVLPAKLRSFVPIAAEAKNAPIDYVAWGILAVSASLIGNSRKVEVWNGWKEPSALWVSIVGPPSSNKSPALDVVVDVLNRIQQEYHLEYARNHSEWKSRQLLVKIAEKEFRGSVQTAAGSGQSLPELPEILQNNAKPILRRLLVADATVEAICNVLDQNPRGILLSRDELAGWLEGMGRYNNGGDTPFFLESFGGRSYTVDRKSIGTPITIERCLLSILGSTQPDKLNSLLGSGVDDGLAARIAMIWPAPIPLARPTVSYDDTILEKVFRHLLSLCPRVSEKNPREPILVEFDESSRVIFQAFRERMQTTIATYEGMVASHFGKFGGLVARMALVLKCLDDALGEAISDNLTITEDQVGRSIKLFETYMIPMAIRVYGDAGLPKAERHARRIARAIVEGEFGQDFAARDIQRKKWSSLQTADAVSAALRTLAEAGWIARDLQPTAGRTATRWIVNPNLPEPH